MRYKTNPIPKRQQALPYANIWPYLPQSIATMEFQIIKKCTARFQGTTYSIAGTIRNMEETHAIA
jgi:hypothetical protein